jgi:Arc/MetJ-type ribon-helix-helix transcriptional regulator
MKKLIDLLRENLEEETMEVKEAITKNYNVVDEVGKFFVVSKPGTKSTKEEIMFEADPFSLAEKIKNGLTYENIMGMYKNKSDASRTATEALKARDTQIDELKSSMDEFRTSKKDIDEKKARAKELIQKLKQ